MPKSIAIIGDMDFISGFKALDCALYPTDDKTGLRALFIEVAEAGFLCVFILEGCAVKIMDLLEQYKEKSRPIIIPLADFRGGLTVAQEMLSRLTVRAVGKDIT